MEKITRFRNFIFIVSLISWILGIAVISGWILHIGLLTSVLPGYTTMKVNSAICIAFLGIGLMVCLPPQKLSYRLIRTLSGSLVLLIGTLTLLEHIFSINLQLDEMLYDYAPNINGLKPGRMSPQTAACFTLSGLALLLIRSKKHTALLAGQFMLHTVTLVSFIVMMGYLFRADELHRFMLDYSMALHTSIVFYIYSVAASLINPELGITGMFTGNMGGNLMARKLFFYMLPGIVLISYLRILGHWHSLVMVEVAVATVTVLFVLMTILLLWITTVALNKYELKSKIAREDLSIVLESAPYSIIMTNGSGIIKMVNRQTEKLYRYDRKELIGKHIKLLIPDQFHSAYERNSKRIALEGTPQSFGTNEDLFAINKHGEEFPVELNVCTTKLRKQRAVIISVIDISQRKRSEQIIKNQLAELQYKNQELEQFNYISSHDLQEPLRTVLNYITLLDEDYPELNEEVQTHHKAIEGAVKRMSMVVRSLLEFGRLGKEKKLVCTDIGTLINDVVTDLKGVIDESDAQVNIICDLPSLYAYETELRQLFQNLITNAIKFRKEGMAPVIEICAEKVESYFEFSVSDNGIGIQEQYHDKVFHIFQRLNKEEDYEGHGIGLANCKKIAEMHGGKIWIESAPGEGSTFKFTILNFKP